MIVNNKNWEFQPAYMPRDAVPEVEDRTFGDMPPLPCAKCNTFPEVDFKKVLHLQLGVKWKVRLRCELCNQATAFNLDGKLVRSEWNRRFA